MAEKGVKKVRQVTEVVLCFAEGKMTFPDKLDEPSRTIITERVVKHPRFKHTVFKDGVLRRLTPIELKDSMASRIIIPNSRYYRLKRHFLWVMRLWLISLKNWEQHLRSIS